MRRGKAIACGLCAVTIAVLSGCQAVFPAALRINYDGSVDYVTCVSETPGLSQWLAMSYESTKQTNGLELQPVGALSPASAGQVVHFQRPTGKWRSVVVGASSHALVSIESDKVSLGEWIWSTDERCPIDE